MWRVVTQNEVSDGLAGKPYAVFERERLIELAQVMPDTRSAVLLCLAWQAARQEALKRGPDAGQPVARLSGPQLAQMTGRSLRTVRYALSRLQEAGTITCDKREPGKTAAYRVVKPGKEGASGAPWRGHGKAS